MGDDVVSLLGLPLLRRDETVVAPEEVVEVVGVVEEVVEVEGVEVVKVVEVVEVAPEEVVEAVVFSFVSPLEPMARVGGSVDRCNRIRLP